MRVRATIQNSALLAAALLVAIALGEATIRVLGGIQGIDYALYLTELTDSQRLPRQLWVEPADGLGGPWRHYPPFRPGAQAAVTTSDFSVVYRINDTGLRDTARTYERPAGIARVVAHGDSFTFGVGVPYGQRFTDVAERLLGDVEIVNMGVPGYGLDHVLLSQLAEGHRYAPDLVVVFVNIHVLRRDATGMVRDGRLRIPPDLHSALGEPGGDPGTAYLRPDDPLFAPGWRRVLRHSHLLSYLTYRVQVWRLRDRLRESDAQYWGYARPPRILDGRQQDADPERRRRARLIIARLAEECRAAGCRVLVVNIDQLHAFDYLGRIPDVTYIDLSDELNQLGRERRLTFLYDMHYDPDTHVFIGAKLAEALRREIGAIGRQGREAGSPSTPRPAPAANPSH
jgi:hypothetical protein